MGQRGGDHADLGFDERVGPRQVSARSPSFASTLALALLSLGRWFSSSFATSLYRRPACLHPLGTLYQVVRAAAIEARSSPVPVIFPSGFALYQVPLVGVSISIGPWSPGPQTTVANSDQQELKWPFPFAFLPPAPKPPYLGAGVFCLWLFLGFGA